MSSIPIIIFIGAAILGARAPRAGLALIFGALPTYLLRFTVAGVPTTLLELLIIGVAVGLILKEQRAGTLQVTLREVWNRARPVRIPLLALLAAATLGIMVAPETRAAMGVWRAYFVEPMLVGVLALAVIKTDADRKNIFRALGLSALAVSAVALYQWMTGDGIPPPWNLERRATSIFPFPNAVGLFLGPLVILFLGLFREKISKRRFRSAAWWGMVVIFSVLAIIAAKSEGALVAIVAGVLVYGMLLGKKTRMATLIVFAIAIVLVFLSPSRGTVMEKLTLRDWSGVVRRSMWSETAEMLRDRPLLGAGLSGYPSALRPYHRATAIEIFQYPHNIFLTFWSETGLLGLAAFAALLFAFFRRVFAARNAVLAGAMTVILVHGLVDVPYFKNDLAVLFWFFITWPLIAPPLLKSRV